MTWPSNYDLSRFPGQQTGSKQQLVFPQPSRDLPLRQGNCDILPPKFSTCAQPASQTKARFGPGYLGINSPFPPPRGPLILVRPKGIHKDFSTQTQSSTAGPTAFPEEKGSELEDHFFSSVILTYVSLVQLCVFLAQFAVIFWNLPPAVLDRWRSSQDLPGKTHT